MPVDRNKKIIFIHTPKCAGTSIAQALNIYGSKGCHTLDIEHLYGFDSDNNVLQSLCLKYYENYLEDNFIKECFIFGVVRNPYDRVLSDYNWSRRGCKTLYEYLLLIKKTLNSYNEYELMKFKQEHHHNHFLPQYKYFESDKYDMNVILKFENLEQEFSKYIDSSIKLPHVNKSKHLDWKEYFKNKHKCIKMINNIYKKDFELYGYNMLTH